MNEDVIAGEVTEFDEYIGGSEGDCEKYGLCVEEVERMAELRLEL